MMLSSDLIVRHEAEIEGVNFEVFFAIDDELATSTVPNPHAIFQSILAEAGISVEASSAGDDAEEESDNETEMVQKLKKEDIRRMVAQLRCFAAEKCPKMLSEVASTEAALTAYVCKKAVMNGTTAKVSPLIVEGWIGRIEWMDGLKDG
ncbi:hypothetical protein TTRE_0000626201 [Trichuris trichiura]|uniref:Uncharacterized protein n=1 Tax=Trichuris trichiura TaxID=36087 RepID=A0A077ZC37_TRITR|nr:hypothetical protein TTRE_0000626201 [Trichuris trichiura]